MKTMELTLNDALFQSMEQAARQSGLSISEFVLKLINDAFREEMVAEMERQEIEAYIRQPFAAEEFEIWEDEQSSNG